MSGISRTAKPYIVLLGQSNKLLVTHAVVDSPTLVPAAPVTEPASFFPEHKRKSVKAKDYCITGRANVIFSAVALR